VAGRTQAQPESCLNGLQVSALKSRLLSYNQVLSKNSCKIQELGSSLAVMTLVLSGTTSAGIVNVNGILDSKTEYEHKKDLQWFNEHHSIYGPVTPSHTGQTIEIRYQINGDDSVNLFLEVPDYARRMIWTDLEYGPGKVENCDNPVDCKGIPEAILDVGYASM
jgi:hypothetical protein